MDGRIFGIETEYGCLIPDSDFPLNSNQISQKIKDTIFLNTKYGVLDMHYRGRDEPPGNGGFLFNGGRVYIDLGHVEYAMPIDTCEVLLTRIPGLFWERPPGT